MDAQTVIALLIVLAALAYMSRGLWRKLRPGSASAKGGGDCGGPSCGCH